jgi:hypothetical protein
LRQSKRIVNGHGKVLWPQDGKYNVFYCEQFPLEHLRYKDLWELDELGREWREALREDIKERGMKVPLIVWNHHRERIDLAHLSKKPYMLMNGRNRMWAIRDLGWTHAPAIVSGSCEFPCHRMAGPQDLEQYWPDGTLIVSNKGLEVGGKTDARQRIYPK